MDYSVYKEKSIEGRYITMESIGSCLSKLSTAPIPIGDSVNGVEIKAFKLGSGDKKVLMWSQMHGNESTTTKALCDMFNFLGSNEPLAKNILKHSTLMIVPILNPDGAIVYTRENINKIDLNRDAKNLSQPESRALRELFESFEPDFCFNLHDQRTLFSAGKTNKPATVSFLSPASNKDRHITPTREVAMKLIVAMDSMLQNHIPGQVGRYDDGFNDNCVGDTFQKFGAPTVLFESGHYPGDYSREKTREYIFWSLLEALKTIVENRIDCFKTGDYFSIPNNQKLFFDVLILNPTIVNPEIETGHAVGIRYKEVLDGDKITFKPEIAEIGPLEEFYGHQTIECIDNKDFGFRTSQKEILDLLLNFNK
ncbi:M14 family metallopeptidase [[Muricauda] lutisoli]|nr:M14 metallopeptidase family protein [[Muricauda] lutisoli]